MKNNNRDTSAHFLRIRAKMARVVTKCVVGESPNHTISENLPCAAARESPNVGGTVDTCKTMQGEVRL